MKHLLLLAVGLSLLACNPRNKGDTPQGGVFTFKQEQKQLLRSVTSAFVTVPELVLLQAEASEVAGNVAAIVSAEFTPALKNLTAFCKVNTPYPFGSCLCSRSTGNNYDNCPFDYGPKAQYKASSYYIF